MKEKEGWSVVENSASKNKRGLAKAQLKHWQQLQYTSDATVPPQTHRFILYRVVWEGRLRPMDDAAKTSRPGHQSLGL